MYRVCLRQQSASRPPGTTVALDYLFPTTLSVKKLYNTVKVLHQSYRRGYI